MLIFQPKPVKITTQTTKTTKKMTMILNRVSYCLDKIHQSNVYLEASETK